jgi:pimeloyl-ACP methyl ester carboxylesterase
MEDPMFDFDVESVAAAAARDPALGLSARFWSADIVFRMGEEPYRLQVRDGKVARFARDHSDAAADVSISGPAEAWEKLLRAVPPAPYQDPRFGGQRVGFVVEGDLAGAMAPYYAAILDFLAVLRKARSGPSPARPVPRVERRFDAAVGRYMYVDVAGVQQRIYFEEAGTGKVPLILQHTAGADGRQWRHLLEDPDFQRLFRMISYDLPYHGRSLPPTTERWWETEYALSRDVLIETITAISRGLDLDRPVYMGCSIGGFLAPDLALYRPEEFRAVVGLNAGLGIDPAKRNRESEASWAHPRVGGQWRAAAMLANTSPKSPEAYRRETGWIYDQGAQVAMTGDLTYYNQDHDLTEAQAARIDTSKIPVYLLTGEYDQLAYEDGTARLARAIKGSHFEVVPGLGHFGPSENPEDFKAALLPLFEKIAQLA